MAADAAQWTVVAGSSTSNLSFPATPSLPTGHVTRNSGLSGIGAGALGFQWAPSSTLTPDGNWYRAGSTTMAYAQLGVTGPTGPNRAGAESNHVFTALYYGDSFDGGTRAFAAAANDPNAPPSGSALLGIWVWNGAKNAEIARLGMTGALGPAGLDATATYNSFENIDSTNAVDDLWMLPEGNVLFAGRVVASGTPSYGVDSLSRYVPGVGNVVCMMPGATSSSLGPNLPGVSTATFSSISPSKAVSRYGEAYAYAGLNYSGQGNPTAGIWQFCSGAPRPVVLGSVSDGYGPGLGSGVAFSNIPNDGVRPSLPGSFFFSGSGSSFKGLFHHNGALNTNAPIILDNNQTYGPQVSGFVFSNPFAGYSSVSAAGQYAALTTTIAPTTSLQSYTKGVWRLTTSGTVTPVALTGASGIYAPAAGRTWTGDFYKVAAFDNGDIVMLAGTQTVSGSITTTSTSWWRLSIGAAPVEILKVGDMVQVPTTSGVVNAAVTSISSTSATSVSNDTWYTANGTIISNDLTLSGYSGVSVIVSGLASSPDYIFSSAD